MPREENAIKYVFISQPTVRLCNVIEFENRRSLQFRTSTNEKRTNGRKKKSFFFFTLFFRFSRIHELAIFINFLFCLVFFLHLTQWRWFAHSIWCVSIWSYYGVRGRNSYSHFISFVCVWRHHRLYVAIQINLTWTLNNLMLAENTKTLNSSYTRIGSPRKRPIFHSNAFRRNGPFMRIAVYSFSAESNHHLTKETICFNSSRKMRYERVTVLLVAIVSVVQCIGQMIVSVCTLSRQ